MLNKTLIVLAAIFFCANVNAQFQLGSSKGAGGPVTLTQSQTPNTNTFVGNYNNEKIDYVNSVVHNVEESQNFINLGNLSPDSNVALPFGIIKDIGAARYVIAIDSLKFKPNGAFFSAYAAIDFPGTTKKIAFRAGNIKFNPAGVVGGNQARLYLASSHVFQINPTVRLRLLDNGENWVEWDCNGFKAINLVGNFEFSKNKLRPDAAQTSDTIVTAKFQIYTQNIHEFIASINMTPFTVVGLDNWNFKVNNAVVDMSELANAPGMSFPLGYNNPNISPLELWRGFYLKEFKIKLPPELSRTGDVRTEISAYNLLIDNMGVSGLFQVSPIFSLGEGNMNGWDFSIDQLSANFVCNNLTGGGFKGQIKIPVDQVKSLSYEALISKNPATNTIDYAFAVKPTENIDFNVFGAKVNLNNNSCISVVKVGSTFKPTAVLSGYIGFENAKLNSGIGKLNFYNLTIVPQAPYITNGVFGLELTNAAKFKYKNFSISLNNLIVGVDNSNPYLGTDVNLKIADFKSCDFGISTSILVKGKFTKSPTASGPFANNIGKLEFDRITISGANLNFQTGPITLAGGLIFKDNDPVYGDGVFGNLSFSIPHVLPNPIGAAVGFGNTGVYKYFYVDVKIPGPIPIGGSPFVITSIIGGVYYHMAPNKSSPSDFISLSSNFAGSGPLKYVPDPNINLGIKLGAGMMLTSSQFRGDALLDINFNASGSINEVSLTGNLYGTAGSIPIVGNMLLKYNVPSKTFDGMFQVTATYYAIVNANGYLKIHSEPSYWNICAGTPSQPMTVRFLGLSGASGYLMTGHNLELPTGNPKITPSRTAGELNTGQGLCIGSNIKSNIDGGLPWSFFSVKFHLDFDAGFDVMIKNYGQNAKCSGQPVGINGRQVEGNAYLYLDAKVSIQGHFKFPGDCPKEYQCHLLCCHGCGILSYSNCKTITTGCLFNESFDKTIFQSSLDMGVSAKLPKPVYFTGYIKKPYNYFGGRVSGDVDFNFKYGDDCQITY
jgi:hypothetical protein